MSSKKDFPHPFSELARKYRKVRSELPRDASVIAVNHFKTNFRRQGSYTETGLRPWKARKGKKGGSLLVKSGRLKRSLRAAPTYDDARVVTDVPYAQAHNEGVKKTVRVRSYTRNHYGTKKVGKGTFSIKSRKENTRKMKFKNGSSKVRSFIRKMNLPARPFMNTDPLLLRLLERMYFNTLRKLWD